MECGKQKKSVFVPAHVSAEHLLERAKEEFDRTDLAVLKYSKHSDTWEEAEGQLEFSEGDTIKVNILSAKVSICRMDSGQQT